MGGKPKTYKDYVREAADRGDKIAIETLERWRSKREDSFIPREVWGCVRTLDGKFETI